MNDNVDFLVRTMCGSFNVRFYVQGFKSASRHLSFQLIIRRRVIPGGHIFLAFLLQGIPKAWLQVVFSASSQCSSFFATVAAWEWTCQKLKRKTFHHCLCLVDCCSHVKNGNHGGIRHWWRKRALPSMRGLRASNWTLLRLLPRRFEDSDREMGRRARNPTLHGLRW